MNMCSHQSPPQMTGLPLKFSPKPDAVPHAIHNPATIPVHWEEEEVKKLLDRDVEIGIPGVYIVHNTMARGGGKKNGAGEKK